MSASQGVQLPPITLPPIPNVEFDLIAQLAGSCVSAKVAKRLQQGLTMSVPEVVAAATLHFADARPLPSGTTPMQEAWQRMSAMNPRVVSAPGQRRLVVTRSGNSNTKKIESELYGAAVGVAIAQRLYEVSLAQITPRNFSRSVLHDFDIALGSAIVRLEVRGRGSYCDSVVATALSDIDKKFTTVSPRDFNSAMGEVLFPSDDANRAHPDVVLTDPPGGSSRLSRIQLGRRLLSHYYAFFAQKNEGVASDLRDLLSLDDQQLADQLGVGVAFLLDTDNLPPRRIGYFGRTSVHLAGHRFIGSWFEGWVAPSWLQASSVGVFFWGLWEQLIPLLGTWDVLSLTTLSRETQSGTTRNGSQVVLLTDGTIMIWAPSPKALRSL